MVAVLRVVASEHARFAERTNRSFVAKLAAPPKPPKKTVFDLAGKATKTEIRSAPDKRTHVAVFTMADGATVEYRLSLVEIIEMSDSHRVVQSDGRQEALLVFKIGPVNLLHRMLFRMLPDALIEFEQKKQISASQKTRSGKTERVRESRRDARKEEGKK